MLTVCTAVSLADTHTRSYNIILTVIKQIFRFFW